MSSAALPASFQPMQSETTTNPAHALDGGIPSRLHIEPDRPAASGVHRERVGESSGRRDSISVPCRTHMARRH